MEKIRRLITKMLRSSAVTRTRVERLERRVEELERALDGKVNRL